jgi:hypothetical protein
MTVQQLVLQPLTYRLTHCSDETISHIKREQYSFSCIKLQQPQMMTTRVSAAQSVLLLRVRAPYQSPSTAFLSSLTLPSSLD